MEKPGSNPKRVKNEATRQIEIDQLCRLCRLWWLLVPFVSFVSRCVPFLPFVSIFMPFVICVNIYAVVCATDFKSSCCSLFLSRFGCPLSDWTAHGNKKHPEWKWQKNEFSMLAHRGLRAARFSPNFNPLQPLWPRLETVLSTKLVQFRDVSSVSPRVELVQKREWRQVGWLWVEATTVTHVIFHSRM